MERSNGKQEDQEHRHIKTKELRPQKKDLNAEDRVGREEMIVFSQLDGFIVKSS